VIYHFGLDMHDIAQFLARHPPFDTLEEKELEEVSSAAEIEFYAAGTAILESAEATSRFAYVVRRGSVELLVDGRLHDLLGEGEMFAFASLLQDAPLGFVARAAEDTLAYRFPEHAILPVLERAAAVRFVVRSLTRDVQLLTRPEEPPVPSGGGRRVRELLRSPALVCPPETSVQDAARRMVAEGATCVLVDLGERHGIVTDRDIRTRVVADGAGPETPVSEVMSAPAWTVAADRSGTEALLEMLDHGIRHLPVVAPDGSLLGVLDDVDLMASERRAPFRLRAQIARGTDVAAVAGAAEQLPATVIALHDAEVPAAAVSRVMAGIHDTIVRRLIELAHEELGAPEVPYAWLATGSYARREPFPSSDVDSALAWDGPADEPALRSRLAAVAELVAQGIEACGLRSDPRGAMAGRPLFTRSIEGWERAVAAWTRDPDEGRGLMLMSVVIECDAVWGSTVLGRRIGAAAAGAPDRGLLLSRFAAAALAERPPTGFLRDFVLHSTGERKGVLDIKRGGLLPIESLARWSGLAAGIGAASTSERLRASEVAGTLSSSDAATLRDALELMSALRMEHQVEQLRAGRKPDDLIAPKSLPPVTRTALKEAFRAVRRVQRGIAVALGMSGR
jgi:CBS domain-containing protein